MEKFGENFKGGKQTKPCKESMDNQNHSFLCKVVSRNISVNGNYEDILYLLHPNKFKYRHTKCNIRARAQVSTEHTVPLNSDFEL